MYKPIKFEQFDTMGSSIISEAELYAMKEIEKNKELYDFGNSVAKRLFEKIVEIQNKTYEKVINNIKRNPLRYIVYKSIPTLIQEEVRKALPKGEFIFKDKRTDQDWGRKVFSLNEVKEVQLRDGREIFIKNKDDDYISFSGEDFVLFKQELILNIQLDVE